MVIDFSEGGQTFATLLAGGIRKADIVLEAGDASSAERASVETNEREKTYLGYELLTVNTLLNDFSYKFGFLPQIYGCFHGAYHMAQEICDG